MNGCSINIEDALGISWAQYARKAGVRGGAFRYGRSAVRFDAAPCKGLEKCATRPVSRPLPKSFLLMKDARSPRQSICWCAGSLVDRPRKKRLAGWQAKDRVLCRNAFGSWLCRARRGLLAVVAESGLPSVLVTGSGQGTLLERLDTDYPGAFPMEACDGLRCPSREAGSGAVFGRFGESRCRRLLPASASITPRLEWSHLREPVFYHRGAQSTYLLPERLWKPEPI